MVSKSNASDLSYWKFYYSNRTNRRTYFIYRLSSMKPFLSLMAYKYFALQNMMLAWFDVDIEAPSHLGANILGLNPSNFLLGN